MNIVKKLTLTSLLTLLVSACATQETATERDFGNSVRDMVARQTANPKPEAPGEESGDGARLEAVIDAYRSDAGSRQAIDRPINIDPESSL
jgi:type IV pilus biogenesis protein CpaD/CtpE